MSKHSEGRLENAPGGPAPGPVLDCGISFNKNATKFGAALAAAVQVLVADGTYDKIFAKWDLTPLRAPVEILKEE
jgi:polar amino acid transport system substrate-binding protein